MEQMMDGAFLIGKNFLNSRPTINIKLSKYPILVKEQSKI